MTAAKAWAATLGGNLAVIAGWLLTKIPYWDQIPSEPKAAIVAIVCGGIAAVPVYYARNRETVPTTPAPSLSLTGEPR